MQTVTLGSTGITVNKNSIPNDPQSPFVTSGVRIGTPAVTSRGMKEEDMKNTAIYRKASTPGKNCKTIVDKCPPEEYNPVLLLMKYEYYSLGGCIYE